MYCLWVWWVYISILKSLLRNISCDNLYSSLIALNTSVLDFPCLCFAVEPYLDSKLPEKSQHAEVQPMHKYDEMRNTTERERRHVSIDECGQATFLLLFIWTGSIHASANPETSQYYCHRIWSRVINPSSQEAQWWANAATWLLGYGQQMPCQTGFWAQQAHVTMHLPMQT